MFFQAWVADSRKPNGVACQRVRQNKVDSAPLLVIGAQRADFSGPDNVLQRPSLSPQFRYRSPAVDLLIVARRARQILDGDSKTRVFDLEIAMTVVIVRQQPFFQCWLQVWMAASATQPNFECFKDNERVPRVNVGSRPLSKRSGQVDGFSVSTALTALERQSIKIGPSSELRCVLLCRPRSKSSSGSKCEKCDQARQALLPDSGCMERNARKPFNKHGTSGKRRRRMRRKKQYRKEETQDAGA